MVNFLRDYAQHGNARISDLAEIELLTPIKSKLSKLFNCMVENVAVLSSASEFLSQLPYIIGKSNSGKVIMIRSDFPSLIRPWLGANSRGKRFDITLVDDTSETSLTEKILNEVDSKTLAIIVSHVQFSTGTKVHLKKIKDAATKVGAYFILDVTQSAGAIPISDEGLPADALVCSGYKWLGGHGGAGFAILSDKLLEIEPLATGWMSSHRPFEMNTSNLDFSDSAMKYTQSTMSYVTIKGIEKSLKQILELNIQSIQEHSVSLSANFLKKIEGSEWRPFRPKEDTESSPHIIVIDKEGQNITEIFNKLNQEKIIVSMRNNRIRISLAHYNSLDDINTLAEVLFRI